MSIATPASVDSFNSFAVRHQPVIGPTLSLEGQHTVYYLINRPDGEYHGIAACGQAGDAGCERVSHKIVRVAGMTQAVVVTADQIAKGIADEGKAVFYGLYFDTDKAVLFTRQ